jgi:UMF1 family MFS transporter
MTLIDRQTSRATEPSRPALFSWCLYDWANSAFSTVVITFVFSAYFTQSVAEDPIVGTALWGRTLGLAALIVALVSPVLGAIADKTGSRKPWLGGFTAISILATAMLWYIEPSPDYALAALFLVGLGVIAFDFTGVFYNALLPALAPPDKVGRLSGWGWGAGYAGGLACLVIALFGLVQTNTPWLGLDIDRAEHVRATMLLVAVWFGIFAVPVFLFTPDSGRAQHSLGTAIRSGFRELSDTFRNVRQHKNIVKFLVARMLYIDGLNTLFSFAGIYAAGTFGMSVADIIRFGIALNITAGLGAAAFAWIDDWSGSKKTILISLGSLIILVGAALLIESKVLFWLLGLAIGIFVGPIQAASRSFMARLAPKDMETEMFGFFAFSGKALAFVGPLLVSTITLQFESQRLGMAIILCLFVAGLFVLLSVAYPATKPGTER